jgi:hypothetical protein
MPTKTPLRIYFLAIAVWLSAASAAFAQVPPPDITLKLSPAQVAEIGRLIDLQPISISPPAAYWDLQATIDKALQANPAAMRAVLSARSAQR